MNLENGLFDVNTRTLLPHSEDHLTAVQLPVRYDPAADAAVWLEFARETLPKDTQEILGQIAAWTMTPETSIQKAIALTGREATANPHFSRA
ncbi:MAG TPA: hypothetical protein VMB03_31060 [Bryobacteraceae bacterium]|nr:hypothetical protein [Bryobacteraceae bacterium]